MGNTSSQSETPPTTPQSQEERKPIRLCGTLPAEVVPAERYVQQLWQALDKTHEMAQYGLKSDTPVGQGGTLVLLQSVSGLLAGASNCQHTREPVVKVVRTKSTAELVGDTISLMNHVEAAHLNLPCAPMPIPDTDDTSLMHPALVTELTLSKPCYRQGGLIPHLSRKGLFWKSTRLAIHETVLQYQLHLDPTGQAHLSHMDKISCGWIHTVPRISDYNPSTGLHKSLAIDCVQGNSQYWVAKDGTTAKAASPAGPPSWSGAVQGLTQHFEQLSMKSGTQS